jgi:hypothetical protein
MSQADKGEHVLINLAGQRVASGTKGLLIIDEKKLICK